LGFPDPFVQGGDPELVPQASHHGRAKVHAAQVGVDRLKRGGAVGRPHQVLELDIVADKGIAAERDLPFVGRGWALHSAERAEQPDVRLRMRRQIGEKVTQSRIREVENYDVVREEIPDIECVTPPDRTCLFLGRTARDLGPDAEHVEGVGQEAGLCRVGYNRTQGDGGTGDGGKGGRNRARIRQFTVLIDSDLTDDRDAHGLHGATVDGMRGTAPVKLLSGTRGDPENMIPFERAEWTARAYLSWIEAPVNSSPQGPFASTISCATAMKNDVAGGAAPAVQMATGTVGA